MTDSNFISFYDEFIEEETTLDIRDIEEISLIDGKIIIFNYDGLSFKTTKIMF